MAGKHDMTLAQKLSGFITRHGSSKSKRAPGTAADDGHEASSVFSFKRQKKTPSPESIVEYKPLEVDLNQLKSLGLSEGWLEKPTPPNADHDQERPPPPAPADNTTTPIASLFESKSVLNLLGSEQLSRSGSENHAGNDTRPFSMVETHNVAYSRRSADLGSTRDSQASGSILDRGRPIEPTSFVTDQVRKPKSLRQEHSPHNNITAAEKTTTPVTVSRKPLRSEVSPITPKLSVPSQLRPRERAIVDTSNRHSMHAVATSPSDPVAAAKTTVPGSRSASAMPLGRIQAWQKSVTSAPSSRSTTGSASNPAVPSTGTIPARKASTRGVGNRLAWIRELEEKKSSEANKDLGVLKKQAGSVSDRLAMFESKQGRGPSPVLPSRLPPLSRTNSTTSRLSSVALESGSSVNGNTTSTPRTSIDTARSSHRTSSVMDNYDDSFREKMECLVGDFTADKDKPDAQQEKQRGTNQSVPVGAEKAAVKEPLPAQPEADASDAKPEKEEKEVQSPPTEPETADVETEKEEKVVEEPQPSRPTPVTPKITLEEEEKAVQEPQSSQSEPVTPKADLEMEKKAEEETQSPQTKAATPKADLEMEQKAEEQPQSSLPESVTPEIVIEKDDEKAAEMEEEKEPRATIAEIDSDKKEADPKPPQSEEASDMIPEKAEKEQELPQAETTPEVLADHEAQSDDIPGVEVSS
ncbi:Uu.00g145760.m01.CDS01 [Anthostomella pinea]|uniref:Uu.00g145760.m01.CDS01 n=1 Tax=Anthostomella pinea TaxID=933095 RepID=A0AAI8VKL8_9PEZI|nr:Uu.00g145760.m01.CDS01 [Anthostomella pinea]